MEIDRKGIRILVLLLTALIVLLLAPSALAEGGVTNPRQQYVLELEKQPRPKTTGLHQASPDSTLSQTVIEPVTFSQRTAPRLDGAGSWYITFNSEVYGSPLSATVTLSMKDYTSSYTTVYSKDYSYLPSYVSSCKIVSGGEYELGVWVKTTKSGNGCYVGFVYFTISDDSSHTSLTEKISEVVSQCRADTQWQTALNLHDWLINHVYYDLEYTYYGADMILRGYGVCDGYAKAYLMLCKKAGISVYRVTNVSHAWNALYLDGNWYYVDCTWDDPAGGTKPVSGHEGHTYFCLNTELLALDHPNTWEWTGTSTKNLTALDDNYYVRRKDWIGIGNLLYNKSTYTMTCYSAEITAQIAANRGGNYISFGDFFYVTENGGWNVTYPLSTGIKRGWMLLAYAMGKEPMEIPGFGTVRLNVFFSEQNKCFIYSIKGFNLAETGTLTLPSKLKTIESEAFANTRATTVRIPSGCTSIGSYAFRNSSVHQIYIPASVTYIDGTAFSGCSPLLILCPGGSDASGFAMDNGILWHYQ